MTLTNIEVYCIYCKTKHEINKRNNVLACKNRE